MAITTESFNADGVNRIFTVASTILSQSHCRVDYFYDDGSGTAADHEIPPTLWDVINNSIVFKEAPTSGYVVKITVSTDGAGLDEAPSVYSDLAAIAGEIKIVADNIDKIDNDRLFTSTTLGAFIVPENNNELLMQPFEFNTLTIEDNSTLGILDAEEQLASISDTSKADVLQTVNTTTIYDDEITDKTYKLYVSDGDIVLEEL